MTKKQIPEGEQYKQKCYQNQYVEDPKNKFIKVHTISPVNCESNKLCNIENDHATEHVTNHMYETIVFMQIVSHNL
jgi:hypothetical protein